MNLPLQALRASHHHHPDVGGGDSVNCGHHYETGQSYPELNSVWNDLINEHDIQNLVHIFPLVQHSQRNIL